MQLLHIQDNRTTATSWLQFRAEIFNRLNHSDLNTPNLITFTSSSIGKKRLAQRAISTSTTSRQIQFALKLVW